MRICLREAGRGGKDDWARSEDGRIEFGELALAFLEWKGQSKTG